MFLKNLQKRCWNSKRKRSLVLTGQQEKDGSLLTREASGGTGSERQKEAKSAPNPTSSKTITDEGEPKTFPGLKSPSRSTAASPASQ